MSRTASVFEEAITRLRAMAKECVGSEFEEALLRAAIADLTYINANVPTTYGSADCVIKIPTDNSTQN